MTDPTPTSSPDDRALELASAVVDGVATDAERAEVQADPALVALVQRLASVRARLAIGSPAPELTDRHVSRALAAWSATGAAPGEVADGVRPAAGSDAATGGVAGSRSGPGARTEDAFEAESDEGPAAGPRAGSNAGAEAGSDAGADGVVVPLGSRGSLARWRRHLPALGAVAAALLVVVAAVGLVDLGGSDDDDFAATGAAMGGDDSATERQFDGDADAALNEVEVLRAFANADELVLHVRGTLGDQPPAATAAGGGSGGSSTGGTAGGVAGGASPGADSADDTAEDEAEDGGELDSDGDDEVPQSADGDDGATAFPDSGSADRPTAESGSGSLSSGCDPVAFLGVATSDVVFFERVVLDDVVVTVLVADVDPSTDSAGANRRLFAVDEACGLVLDRVY